jgi:hypothetical protein
VWEAFKNLKIWTIFPWLGKGIAILGFWFSRPFVWLWQGIVWVVKQLVRFFKWIGGILADLKKLNDLFHKICPRNEPRRVL